MDERQEDQPAARRWAEALAAWAIPDAILAGAAASPWTFPPELFARLAEEALADVDGGPSRARARDALPAGGRVLDVGVGGGAASLPLAPPAGKLVGVDQSAAMLAAFGEAAERRGVDHAVVEGSWPEVAGRVEAADVVVCHHVAYNVAALVPFAAALGGRARRRVVLELTERHPMQWTAPFWLALHGLERPSAPVADDAVAVLTELGLEVGVERCERPSMWAGADPAEAVSFLRLRLCLGPDRDDEIARLLADHPPEPVRRLVTVWWDTGRQGTDLGGVRILGG